MRRWAVVLSALTVSLGAATVVTGNASAGNDNDPYTLSGGNAQGGPVGGIVHAKDARPGGGGGPKSPNLTWHGGRVHSGQTTVYPVFWGGSWQNGGGADVVQGMKDFYGAVGNTPYMRTNAEYTSGGYSGNAYTGSPVSTAVSLGTGNYFDYSAAPSRS